MAPQKHSPAIKKGAKVAVIGAGRIGCELLKTLALSGCQDIHIIDKDVVQVDDLNGQFLFQQSHVGESKAIVAGRAVLEFRPHITITPYHEDVKGPFYDEDFLQQFNVVLSAIGNLNTKRVVNRVCIDADVPYIQSWTDGFLGQVTVHVKGKTECYECQPKPAPKTHPVCTIISSTPYDIFKHGLFDGEAIIGIPTIATTNAIIAGLMVIETLKVLQEDTKNYRMTCCLEHPTNKMLLMPVEPCEPNKSCYVCSETPLSLEIEINTKCANLRDIVEKVVKRKLGMNSPLIRHGAALLYVSDTDDDNEISAYEENLNTVLSELSSPVTSGSMLSIMDFQQRLTCYISIKHREEFDEEKEPDGMVLSGLTPATSVVKDDDKKSNANAGSTSSALELEADKNDEIESALGKKRKRSEVSEADISSVAGDTKSHQILKVDDEILIGKRSRSVDWEKEPHHLGANLGASAAAPSLINKGFKFGEPKAAGVASSYSPLVVGGQGCRICGDGCHHTVTCPLLKYARPGSTVGPDYLVICGECGDKLRQPTPKRCLNCGERGGLAVEVSTYDKLYGTDRLPRFWEPVESEDDYMELDNCMDLVENIDLENHIADVARAYMESSWCKRFSSTVIDS